MTAPYEPRREPTNEELAAAEVRYEQPPTRDLQPYAPRPAPPANNATRRRAIVATSLFFALVAVMAVIALLGLVLFAAPMP